MELQLLQNSGSMLAGAGIIIFLIFTLVFAVIPIAGMWKTFEKAERPGWAALVPFYNFYVLLEISGNPGWYVVLLFIPVANLYAAGKALAGISRRFGKGIGFALGLFFLPMIFFPILGFGSAEYNSV